MSKIVSMSSGAIDPIAQSKRVFWRPATEATVIKVGQPVCYHSDSILDHKGRGIDPTHLGLRIDTYADGAQDKTARLFCVEEPLTANLGAFAGIVKVLGPKAGANGDMIEIWIPNGAVLPCRIDQSVTLDETVLGIRDGEADVSYPGNGVTNPGRPIGIAKETIDRSADADNGLCWVKVDSNMFSFQYGISDATYLKIEGTHPVNKNYVEFVSTTPVIGFLQDNRLHSTAAIASGQLTVMNNYLRLTGSSTAAGATYLRGSVNSIHTDGCTLNGAGLLLAGCYASIGGTITANTKVNFMCALWIDTAVTINPTTGNYYGVRFTNRGDIPAGYLDSVYSYSLGNADYFMKFDGESAGGGHDCIVAFTANHDTDAGDRALKCDIGGTTYYIPLFNGVGA